MSEITELAAETLHLQRTARVAGDPRLLIIDDEEAIRLLRERFGIEAKRSEGVVSFHVAGGEHFVPRLFDEWDPAHPTIRAVSVARPSLDDVFMSYTGTTIRDAEATSTDRISSENPYSECDAVNRIAVAISPNRGWSAPLKRISSPMAGRTASAAIPTGLVTSPPKI